MENKKTKIISIVAVVALVLTLITATYAYFQAQTGEGSQTDVKINASTVDTLSFETGSAISLSIDQENFANNTGNKVGSTFAKAILTANNKTNTATEHYYLYLNIDNNTFTYTQNANTPEILLTIKDGSNNEVTRIDGLTYKTVTDGKGATLKGFDITTKSGLITLFNNREITTTSSKTDTWNIAVTFINYNLDQSANAGKSFSANLMIQKKEQKTTLANYVKSQYTGTQGENNIYYHDSTLVNGAGDNSYRYAGASPNNYVCFGSDASPCPEDNLYRMIGLFDGNVKLIKASVARSNLLGTNGTYYSDTVYEWSSIDTCPSSIAYNYIDGINLLASKNTIAAGDIGGGCNSWNYSDFKTINLNTNYLNNIGSNWVNMIEDAVWKVEGYFSVSVTAKTLYDAEITNANKTYSPSDGISKIGLMYASDYGYAVFSNAWTDNLVNYNSYVRDNWLSIGISEWTLSSNTSSSNGAFSIKDNGSINGDLVGSVLGARPVFYLKSSVKYVDGTGTIDSPIILEG